MPAHRGESHHNSKLSNRQVEAIRKYLAMGVSQSEVARQFKISQPTVNRIANGTAWIEDDDPLPQPSGEEFFDAPETE